MARAAEAEVWQAMSALVLDHDRRQEVVDALGMSFFRIKALRRIAATGPLSMTELVGSLRTDRAYVTLVVDDLEKRGYVVRSTNPDDRRAKIVTITAEGRKAARRAVAILERPPAALRNLADADLIELSRLLGLLRR